MEYSDGAGESANGQDAPVDYYKESMKYIEEYYSKQRQLQTTPSQESAS